MLTIGMSGDSLWAPLTIAIFTAFVALAIHRNDLRNKHKRNQVQTLARWIESVLRESTRCRAYLYALAELSNATTDCKSDKMWEMQMYQRNRTNSTLDQYTQADIERKSMSAELTILQLPSTLRIHIRELDALCSSMHDEAFKHPNNGSISLKDTMYQTANKSDELKLEIESKIHNITKCAARIFELNEYFDSP